MHNMFKMHDMQYMLNMFTPVTQGGKILDIDLVLGRISSTIQIVPLNEINVIPTSSLEGSNVGFNGYSLLCSSTSSASSPSRKEEEDVPHIYGTNLGWNFSM
jgi:hypothetical protein